MAYDLKIDRNQAGRRLDHILRGTFPEVPLSTLYRWIRQGLVRIKGQRVKPGSKPISGDLVRLPQKPGIGTTKKSAVTTTSATSLNLKIIAEQPGLLLIDKASGLNVQPGTDRREESLIEQVWRYLGCAADDLFKPALLQRLDRGTSGVILVAKDGPTLRQLSQAVRERKVEKTYLALVCGTPRPARGTLEEKLPMAKTYRKGIKGGQRKSTSRSVGARTDYKVLASTKQHALLAVYPQSGRKHQIRQQLANLGHPIAGDTRYGQSHNNRTLKKEFALGRLFLHAWSLSILPPYSPEATFVAPLPGELRKVLAAIGIDFDRERFTARMKRPTNRKG